MTDITARLASLPPTFSRSLNGYVIYIDQDTPSRSEQNAQEKLLELVKSYDAHVCPIEVFASLASLPIPATRYLYVYTGSVPPPALVDLPQIEYTRRSQVKEISKLAERQYLRIRAFNPDQLNIEMPLLPLESSLFHEFIKSLGSMQINRQATINFIISLLKLDQAQDDGSAEKPDEKDGDEDETDESREGEGGEELDFLEWVERELENEADSEGSEFEKYLYAVVNAEISYFTYRYT